MISFFFFFNDTATTEIYTLSLHDALPILSAQPSKSAAVLPTWITATMPRRVAAAHTRSHEGCPCDTARSEEHTSELQSHSDLVCRLLLEKKKQRKPVAGKNLRSSLKCV